MEAYLTEFGSFIAEQYTLGLSIDDLVTVIHD
jgi:hypothetical protein